MMHGLLDSIELLTPAARDVVLALAETWPHRKLREAAKALLHPPEPAPGPVSASTSMQGAPTTFSAQPPLF